MPICHTCQGEYMRAESLCPHCQHPLGRGTTVCQHCKQPTDEHRLCPRCKRDVSAWEKELASTLGHFILRRWGVVGLLPSLGAIILWLTYWQKHQLSLHRPADTLLGIILSFFIFTMLYEDRLLMWERSWAAEVYNVAPTRPSRTIGVAIVGGLFLSFVLIYVNRHWGETGGFELKLLFALGYAAALICFTVACTMGVLMAEIGRLNQSMPQPLFVQIEHLLQVVLDTILEKIEGGHGEDILQRTHTADANLRYEILEVNRIPEDGGIRLLLLTYKHIQRPDEDAQMRAYWVKEVWNIDADRWGRVRSLKPGKSEAAESR
ncbi:MAG: zinc ribbon domain-containing protein [Anaerolineae bacterium]|nr:zinc ribbon domain-containing protein [Anaerolineae bacterium]